MQVRGLGLRRSDRESQKSQKSTASTGASSEASAAGTTAVAAAGGDPMQQQQQQQQPVSPASRHISVPPHMRLHRVPEDEWVQTPHQVLETRFFYRCEFSANIFHIYFFFCFNWSKAVNASAVIAIRWHLTGLHPSFSPPCARGPPGLLLRRPVHERRRAAGSDSPKSRKKTLHEMQFFVRTTTLGRTCPSGCRSA